MSPEPEDFASLYLRARGGDQDACRALTEFFGDAVLRVIRHRLSKRVRPVRDPVDVLQSVWVDFFSRVLPHETFEDPQRFLAFLNKMAEKKVLLVHRRLLHAQKRDRRRQVSLDAPGPAVQPVVDRAPPPTEVATAEDEWDWLRRQFPQPARRLVDMLREGYSQHEVTAALGIPERTLRRVLERARQRLAEGNHRLEGG